jgi:thymidylate synthase (FAD)
MSNEAFRRRVLDHGWVLLRNVSGPTRRESPFDDSQPFDASDIDPAQAARMSFDQMDSDRSLSDDMKLARYLMKNWHTSPFEQIQVWIEMHLPIFVARQFVRHRTVRLNEVSGRYVTLPAVWYIPELQHVVMQSKDKKQGGKPVDLNDPEQVRKAENYRARLALNCERCYDSYTWSIQDGVAMEQARLDLHLNHYTHWLWNQDLHNLMHFLSLRVHDHAQYEARCYAEAILELMRMALPETMKLFDELRRR